MLYVVVSTTDASVREAYFRNYGVKYLSTNDQVEPPPVVDPPPVEEGVYRPDMTKWGIQNNNGWSYMYKQGEDYTELVYNAVGTWQPKSFEIYPITQLIFIDRTKAFVGEYGGMPAYAFKAPIGGQVELFFENHGLEVMRIEIFKNGELVPDVEGSNDYISFNTTGDGVHGDHTQHIVKMDVKEDTMLYIVVYSTDQNAAREGYIRNYGVRYLSTNDEVEPPPVEPIVYQPDTADWGTQNNNGWYYMFKRSGSVFYNALNYYDSSTGNEWQQNNYAVDPAVERQMLFIAPTFFFVGESGGMPTYAFKAPVGGKAKLSFENHGDSALQLRVYQNDTLVRGVEGSNDYISFNTTGDGVHYDHTKHIITLDVKKDTMIYMVVSSTNPEMRQGYLRNLSVEYLSTNDQAEPAHDPYYGKSYKIDLNSWGAQNNNGWSFMYKERLGNNYFPLDYRGASAGIEWQRERYASNPSLMNEMMFINKTSFFVGEKGSMPTYMYEAPVGGRLELSFLTHGTENMHFQLFKNNELVKINGLNSITFNTDGETRYTVTLDVKKGTKLYLVGYSTNVDIKKGGAREGWVFETEAKYISSNAEVESAVSSIIGKSYTIDIRNGAWGKARNNNWEFMCYDTEDYEFKWLAYVRSQRRFVGSSDTGYEYCMITPSEVHPSVKALPAKVFVAPSGGRLKIEVMAVLFNPGGSNGTGIKIMLGNTQVYPGGEYAKVTGTSKVHTVELNVKKDQRVAVLLDGIDGNINYDSTDMFVCATYLSTNTASAIDITGGSALAEFVSAQAGSDNLVKYTVADVDRADTAENMSISVDGEELATVNAMSQAFPIWIIILAAAAVVGLAGIAALGVLKKSNAKKTMDEA